MRTVLACKLRVVMGLKFQEQIWEEVWPICYLHA